MRARSPCRWLVSGACRFRSHECEVSPWRPRE
jgi:hypothetical protein